MALDETAGIVIEETLSVLMPSFLRRTLSVLFVGVLLVSLFVGFAVVDWSEEGAEAQSTGQPPRPIGDRTPWWLLSTPASTSITIISARRKFIPLASRGPWCDQNMLSDL